MEQSAQDLEDKIKSTINPCEGNEGTGTEETLSKAFSKVAKERLERRTVAKSICCSHEEWNSGANTQ